MPRRTGQRYFVLSCFLFLIFLLYQSRKSPPRESVLRGQLHPPKRNLHQLHRRVQNGLIETNMKGEHPIFVLITEAEKKWTNLVARQSKNLRQAVSEYETRYDRLPPKGFDIWWKFAKEKGFVLVDEFDHIHQNIEPFFALSPKTFNSRVDDLTKNLPFSFHIDIENGSLFLSGQNAHKNRALDLAALIEPFAHLLPNLSIHASDHDRGNIVLGADQYDRALQLARNGSHFTDAELKQLENPSRNKRAKLLNACHPTSNAARDVIPDDNSTHSFLYDPVAGMNYCKNPSLAYIHGVWSFHHTHPNRLEPMWVHCKWIQDHSFLLPALPAFDNIIRDENKVVPWRHRTDSRLFWRARSTGVDFHTGLDWKKAHRIRLHFLANSKEGEVELLQESTNGLVIKKYPRRLMNEMYMDAGLVGPLVQCSEPPPFCENVEKQINWLDLVAQSKGQDAKFVIDVDGNGWSQRYGRLLSTGSVVLKSTVFPEWNTPWLIPYYHFVPIKVDYTDLYDTMAFFSTWPDGTPGHDDLAEKIASNALHFIKHHWRWEDVQVYMFRMLLEYARLASPDREAASFRME